MRFMCLLADGETVETTLDFAMGQVWNWHASVFEQDYMSVRCPDVGQYVRIVVANALYSSWWPQDRNRLLWPLVAPYQPRRLMTMDSWERVAWLDEEWPRMLRRELLGRGRMLYHHEDNELRAKCARWFTRARALRAAKPALVAAVLAIPACACHASSDRAREVMRRVFFHAGRGPRGAHNAGVAWPEQSKASSSRKQCRHIDARSWMKMLLLR